MPVLAEIAMIPVGTGSAGFSQVLADSVKVMDKFNLKYEVTSTGTNVEGDMDTILSAVREMDEVPFREGADRVILMVRFDDRRDKSISLDYEEQSLGEKL